LHLFDCDVRKPQSGGGVPLQDNYWLPRPGIGYLFLPSVHHVSCAISSASSRHSIHVLHLMHRKKQAGRLRRDSATGRARRSSKRNCREHDREE
jgi:hypothetical protein